MYYILNALLRLPEQCWGLFWILCSTVLAAGAAAEQLEQCLVTPFSGGGVWNGGLLPLQMVVIKLRIKEMHLKNVNVNHWAHALYKKNSEHIYIVIRLRTCGQSSDKMQTIVPTCHGHQ